RLPPAPVPLHACHSDASDHHESGGTMTPGIYVCSVNLLPPPVLWGRAGVGACGIALEQGPHPNPPPEYRGRGIGVGCPNSHSWCAFRTLWVLPVILTLCGCGYHQSGGADLASDPNYAWSGLYRE